MTDSNENLGMCAYPGDIVADPEKVKERFEALEEKIDFLERRLILCCHESI